MPQEALGNDGTGSPELTVHAAAGELEGLFSDSGDLAEDKQPPQPKPEGDEPPAPSKKPAPPAPPADDEDDEEDDDPAERERTDADDADDDEEPNATEESDEADEPPPPKTRKIKVAGEEIEVTEDELERGYSRTADYTRKTQELAAEKRRFEEEEVLPTRKAREEYVQKLEQAKRLLDSMAPAEPDWDAIREQDPDGFADRFTHWQQMRKRIAALETEQRAAAEEAVKEQVAEVRRHLQTEFQLLQAAIPEWVDPEIATQERTELKAFAKKLQFTEEDLANVRDHRVMVLLRKAWLFDKSQEALAKAKQTAPPKKAAPATPPTPTVKPGARPPNPPRKKDPRVTAFRANRDVKSAAALIEDLVD